MIAGIITGASFLALVQIAVVVIGWRFKKIRPAVEWQVSFDDHADEALSILLTHEAGVVDGATPDEWAVLEAEFADLDPLAARLGERAR